MNLSCELPKIECIKKPSKADINKLKAANIVPPALINSIFKDLEKDYMLIKKNTKTRTKTKTKGGYMKRYTRKRASRVKNMTGGSLTAYQKNKITDMVILLVAGSSYWFVLPILETYIISVGILPTLCGQNMLEHISTNMFAAEGQSCPARAQRYNTIITSVITAVTASAWYSRNQFTKENLSKNYNKVHRLVKKTIFGPSDTPSPSPSPSPKVKTPEKSPESSQESSPEKSPSVSPGTKKKSARSKLQERQREEEQSPERTTAKRR